MSPSHPFSGPAAGPWKLKRLRHQLSGLDPTLAPGLTDPAKLLPFGIPGIDGALGGGLSCAALHELTPDASIDLGTAAGFAWALATRAGARQGNVLWVATHLAGIEGGQPYAPGLEASGMDASRLITLCVPRPIDVLWTMEEALRCRAMTAVIAELAEAEADLTQTRRLTLAARSGTGLGILLQHRGTPAPSAAATRWRIAAGRSRPDRFGGLGPPVFDLSLVKNRRGPTGRWFVTWDRQERVFHEFGKTLSRGLAEAASDRPHRTPARRAG